MAVNSPVKVKTAAIVVIGDEILRGQTLDTNSQVICKTLYGLSIPVQRITVIPDQVDIIAKEVGCFSSSYDFVITTGGIGPTHDDVTYAGVARGLNRGLAFDPILVDLIRRIFGTEKKDHPMYKMSAVPEGSRIHFNESIGKNCPLVSTENVYMFPGVPFYMQQCLPYLLEDLKPHAQKPPIFKSLYTKLDELSITQALNDAVQQFRTTVSFGSYPNVNNNYYKVQITMESDVNGIADAEKYIRAALPKDTFVSYESSNVVDADKLLYTYLDNIPDRNGVWCKVLNDSVCVVEECILSKYSPSEISVSFNGGKDCTALLHMYHAVLQRHSLCKQERIEAFCIEHCDSFPEVEQFVQETVVRYNLDFCKIKGTIKDGLKQYLDSKPHIKAILMGNRRTDPNSKHLQPFQETDPSWPNVMRVFPLLDWTYHNVWLFLRTFNVPYCILYDSGYTSLGNRHNTAPNPNLKCTNEQGTVFYLPAYKLNDGNMERNGRH